MMNSIAINRILCPLRFGMNRIALMLLVLPVFSFGCKGPAPSSNANSARAGQASNVNANAVAPSQAEQDSSIVIKEPERYSVVITISAQDNAAAEPVPMATQQFGFAKLGADRRWTFNLPAPLGQVAYLEKSGLKYLVFFDRKQYTEVSPDTLSFSMASISPGAIAEHLRPRTQFDKRDAEPLNGRSVFKYRVNAPDKTAENEGAIFVDTETGLPLRSDFQTSPPTGAKTRVIVEARELQLNPDRSLFDVPAGMKKIQTQEAKSQIEEFIGKLRIFADIVSGTRPASTALADRSTPAPVANPRARRRK
jgi:hypothetical protein